MKTVAKICKNNQGQDAIPAWGPFSLTLSFGFISASGDHFSDDQAKQKEICGWVMLGKKLSRHVGHKTFYVFKTMCVFSIAELKPFQHFRGNIIVTGFVPRL